MKKVIFLFTTCLLFGCTLLNKQTNTTKTNYKAATLIKVTLNKTFYGEPPIKYTYEEWIKKYPSNKKFVYKGGTVSLQNSSFNIALRDLNQNGVYNDIDIDLFVINASDAEYMCWNTDNCSATNTIRSKNMIRYFDNSFLIKEIDKEGNYLILEQLPNNTQKPDAFITDSLLNTNVTLATGEKTNLYNLIDDKKEFVFINFWASWCSPCLEEIPDLQEMIKDNRVQIINFCNERNFDDAKKIMEDKQNWGIQCIATPSITKFFNQNGYPYGVLFHNKKLLEQRIRPKKARKFIETYK